MSNCVIDKFGNIRWFLNGELHREDGPAVEWPDGENWWYQNGLLHREDGPAIEWQNGDKEWYLNGEEYSKDEFILLQFSKGIITND